MEALVSSPLFLAPAVLTALILFGSLRSAIRWRSRSKGFPLPPGPKPLPLLGNLFDIPYVQAGSTRCERYAEMSKNYGDMIYLEAMGQRMLIVGSTKVAIDLLEKRSANYSDRPRSIISELVGTQTMFSLAPYGHKWRLHRRQFWQQLYPGMMKKYNLLQQQELYKFLRNVLEDPADLREYLYDMVAATILRAVYNIDTRGKNDPVVAALEEATTGITDNVIPGVMTALVEFFPLVRFWPSFQRRLADFKDSSDILRELPCTEAMRRPVEVDYVSMMEAMRERLAKYGGQDTAFNEEVVKDVAGMAYFAGVETTFSALQSFLIALSLNPNVQKRAQAELDAKIGSNRLPEADDEDQLPYIRATVKEVHRWMNVTPFGLPHASIDDDEYNGYFIPAGTIVMPNVWAMLHDPAVYPNPTAFRPERYMKDGKLNPRAPDPMQAFGFGRRVCPGRHFAERAMFIAVACILAVFNVTPPVDDEGKPIRVKLEQTDNVISFPVDFRCTITPRSEAAVSLVQKEVHGI